MGLLDNNIDYFKHKLFGYSDDDYKTFSIYEPPLTYPKVDTIYDQHKALSTGNRNLSFWDMLKQGNIAGPFRRHFPLEKPDGYDKRWSQRRSHRLNEINNW